MRTSLQGIANKARSNKRYRFRNLYTMLNRLNLEGSWQYMNRRAAPGVDRETVREFEKNLTSNVSDLVERLKEKRYRCKLVKRVYIPKSNGKRRPLGLPATEDKLVQVAVARILTAIYEQDFLKSSYGYRPNMGAHDATDDLRQHIFFRKSYHIVEADIRGYFDSIDHDWLIRMLEERIDDKAFLGLIRKWLKAGILESDGTRINPTTGTPQGGIVSPILANIYLHYVLDLWFAKVVKRHCSGRAFLCRYADDFVCVFQYKEDAERFYRVLSKRLAKFNLTLAIEKSGIIDFRCDPKARFDFLGFEFHWAKSQKGNYTVQRRTSRKNLRTTLKVYNQWCRESRNFRLRKYFDLLNAKLRGYYNYYGVKGNYKSLGQFFYYARRISFKWLNRRSQRRSFNWNTFQEILEHYQIEKPRITEINRRSGQKSFFFAR